MTSTSKIPFDIQKFFLGIFIVMIILTAGIVFLKQFFTSLGTLNLGLFWLVMLSGLIVIIVFKVIFNLTELKGQSIALVVVALVVVVGLMVGLKMYGEGLFSSSVITKDLAYLGSLVNP